MRIHLAAIFHVKIAWLRESKRLVPRTDAYKIAATTVLVLWLMRLSVGAGNPKNYIYACECIYTMRVIAKKIW